MAARSEPRDVQGPLLCSECDAYERGVSSAVDRCDRCGRDCCDFRQDASGRTCLLCISDERDLMRDERDRYIARCQELEARMVDIRGIAR